LAFSNYYCSYYFAATRTFRYSISAFDFQLIKIAYQQATMRFLRLLALLSMFATTVESNMEGDMIVTCNVDEETRNKGDCTESVWDEIDAALLQCSYDGMDLAASQSLETFGVEWQLYTNKTAVRRNLRQERDLKTCRGTCYKPRSSCCLLHSSFCAGKCRNCACSRRLSEEEEIEEVFANRELANEGGKQDQRRRLVGGQDDVVITTCVARLEALRISLLARNNLCMGASITAPITCDANLYGKDESSDHMEGCESAYSPFYCNGESVPEFEPLSGHVCLDFAVHAGTAVTFSGVVSTIQGGVVGVSPGTSITGAFGDGETANPEESAVFAARLLVEHSEAIKVRSHEMDMAIEIGGINEIGGVRFKAGTYRTVGAINFAAGKVTLDGQGDENSIFIFIAGTTLTTAAVTTFELVGGARAENVLWVLGTGATIGIDSTLVGSIMAGTGITFGQRSTLQGCALAQTFVSFAGDGSVILNEE
jgi:hypothetical protein